MITSQFSSVQSLSPVQLFGWHHLLNGSVDMSLSNSGLKLGSLVCCSQWGCKDLDKSGRLNNNKVRNEIFLLHALPVNKPFRNADS